ncbi:MAG: YbdD/YjiX family protein [Gemmatimonadaceae bacterium]
MSPHADGPDRAARRDVQGMARRIGDVIRQIIGAPDYAAYLAHVREQHPDRTPMTEEEFRRERLTARYSRPGSRCC